MIDIIMGIVGFVFIGLGVYSAIRKPNQAEGETNPTNNNLLVSAYIACGFFLILGSLAKFTLAYAIGMLISAGGSLMLARKPKDN